ncbi:MAG: ArsC/Spx/MgsR family protein [Pseudomonadota bacterium]
MTYILIHNPSCGASKKGLALLQEKGIEPEVRKYMNANARLSVDELKEIAAQMGDVSPREFMRAKDVERAGLPADIDGDALIEAMAENPKLIQRPIGINNGKAALGRPAESLLDIV